MVEKVELVNPWGNWAKLHGGPDIVPRDTVNDRPVHED